jgi:hypothetical protein
MDKISITFIQTNEKRYAVFRVDPQFAGDAFRAGYHDLPRDKERVEIRPGNEENLIAALREKIVAAEAAIARHEEFLRSLGETREIDVHGHKVIVNFEPGNAFYWKAQVFLPAAMKEELTEQPKLGKLFDESMETCDGIVLSKFVKDKEEYFAQVKVEMAKIAGEINKVREWKSQPSQEYDLPGGVQAIISPHPEWAFYYKAQVIAPKSLIETARVCGLKLTRNTWSPFGDHHMELTWPLRNSEDVATFLDNIRSEVEEALATEIVAQYSVN